MVNVILKKNQHARVTVVSRPAGECSRLSYRMHSPSTSPAFAWSIQIYICLGKNGTKNIGSFYLESIRLIWFQRKSVYWQVILIYVMYVPVLKNLGTLRWFVNFFIY